MAIKAMLMCLAALGYARELSQGADSGGGGFG